MGHTIHIDGRMGEGGGQVLRTALALSLHTGKPCRVNHVRGQRSKPGLLRQHLTGLRLAATLGAARVSGDHLRSDTVEFKPTQWAAGHHHVQVGTAGSTALVLQSVLPALVLAPEPTSLTIEGGTHCIQAPPFEFVQHTLVPWVCAFGPTVAARLVRPGFFPAGGGCIEVDVAPVSALTPVSLTSRGPIYEVRGRVLGQGMPRRVTSEEAQELSQHLPLDERGARVERLRGGIGMGNAVWVEAHTTIDNHPHQQISSAIGRHGVHAREVAREAVSSHQSWVDSGAPVGPYLADQLLVFMALAGEGRLVTVPLTLHSQTQLELIPRFLPHIRFDVAPRDDGLVEVTVRSSG